MKNIRIIIMLLFIGLLTVSCGNTTKNKENNHGHEHGEESDHKQEEDEHEEHEEGTVSLTKLQMNTIDLRLVTIENKKMSIAVKASGNIEIAAHNKADVSSVIGGIIKNIYVIEGDNVQKGKVLATVEHPNIIQMQQDYINNLNSLQFLEQEYNRRKILYEEKVGSGTAFQKITAEYKNSKASLNAEKMKLKILGLNISAIENGNLSSSINIVSPLKGKVSLIETNIGAYAAPLSKLFEIINNDELHADVMVFEKDINKVKVGQTLKFTTSSLEEQEFTSKIYAISPVFEENPKAVHVHAKIKNKNKDLILGMYIHGQIFADDVLTNVLPEKAVVVENEKSYIFIKTEDEHNHDAKDEHNHDAEDEHNHDAEDEHNHDAEDEHNHDTEDEHNHDAEKWTFKMLEVITGISNNGFVEVKLLNKLPKNAKIVGNGGYFLLAEMGKNETAHVH